MDYKTVTLPTKLDCKDILLPAFSNLMFGNIHEGLDVFDSTEFYSAMNIAEIDYKTFQRINKRYLEGLIRNAGLNTSELFFANADGHILMNKEFTFLFLAFAVPDLASYFNGLLGEIMAEGVAYSDDFVVSLAAQRIPTDILQRIVEDRINNDTQ